MISFCSKSAIKELHKDELLFTELLKLSSKFVIKKDNVQVQPVKKGIMTANNTNNRGKSLQVGIRRR